MLHKSLKFRKINYENLQGRITNRTKIFFQHFLSKRDFEGKLKFNHEKEKLEIVVRVDRHTSQSKSTKDTRALSGGERSFTTVCFVMSLWEAMGAPFRALDEFDVFMVRTMCIYMCLYMYFPCVCTCTFHVPACVLTCVCMCAYMCLYMYHVSACVLTCVCTCTMCLHVCLHVSVHVPCVCMCAYMCLYMYHVSACVLTCVCTCTMSLHVCLHVFVGIHAHVGHGKSEDQHEVDVRPCR